MKKTNKRDEGIDNYDHKSKQLKDIIAFSYYMRKLRFAKDLGFDSVSSAIASMKDFRVFNAEFNKVSHLYLQVLN